MTTLNELVALIADVAGVRCRRGCICRCGRSGLAGALCEAVCAPFGIEPPIYRRRVDFFTKSRAFDITRARAGARLRAARRPARGHPPHAGLVPRRMDGCDVTSTDPAQSAGSAVRAPGSSSAREKYAALVVGRPGLGALLKYELIVMLAQALAGRARPRAAQSAVSVAARLLRPQRRLRPERRAAAPAQDSHRRQRRDRRQLPDRCQRARPIAGIRIGDGVFIGRNTILSCKNGDIELADGANIGFNCELFSASRVRIGANVLMAAYSYVIGGDHDFSDPVEAGARAVAHLGRRVDRRRAPGLARAPRFSTASPSARARSSAPAPWCARTSRPRGRGRHPGARGVHEMTCVAETLVTWRP